MSVKFCLNWCSCDSSANTVSVFLSHTSQRQNCLLSRKNICISHIPSHSPSSLNPPLHIKRHYEFKSNHRLSKLSFNSRQRSIMLSVSSHLQETHSHAATVPLLITSNVKDVITLVLSDRKRERTAFHFNRSLTAHTSR